MSENNDAILQAIQAGFANSERQFTDLVASNSRVENKVDNIESRITNIESSITNVESRITNIESRITNIEAELTEIKTKLAKVESRMHIVDSRLNGVDLRLVDFSDDIRGLQTQQNRVSEYLFSRPQ